jgi:DNA processing protein
MGEEIHKILPERINYTDIRYIGKEDAEFPEKLKELSDCPKGIYVRGSLPDPKKKTVAIVGARMCSPYGRATASYFARELAGAGVQIISGLALGIDGAAHEGALLAGGNTFAVLACGVDICYPRSNIGLYEQMKIQGGILSEEPPGCPPLARLFPKRNRIISALSDVVLVVEAKKKSGSLITADFAAEQGRDLFAIPGRLEDELSRGCNELIEQGAGIALSPERLLEIVGYAQKKSDNSKVVVENVLAREENMVYSCLSLQPRSLEALCKETKLSVMAVTEAVTLLQLRGLVKEIGRNRYVKAQ